MLNKLKQWKRQQGSEDILLYVRQNRLLALDNQQKRRVAEMEELMSAYMEELKEKNDAFLSSLTQTAGEERVTEPKAHHSGNHVFIELEDDGAGINKERVLQKAIDKGIVSSDQALTLSDRQVYEERKSLS